MEKEEGILMNDTSVHSSSFFLPHQDTNRCILCNGSSFRKQSGPGDQEIRATHRLVKGFGEPPRKALHLLVQHFQNPKWSKRTLVFWGIHASTATARKDWRQVDGVHHSVVSVDFVHSCFTVVSVLMLEKDTKTQNLVLKVSKPKKQWSSWKFTHLLIIFPSGVHTYPPHLIENVDYSLLRSQPSIIPVTELSRAT